MNGKPDDDKPYWTLVTRTKRHVYFRSRNNVPGILLFVLIAALGCVALTVGVRHILVADAIQHSDKVLVAIGLGMLILGVYEGCQLWREDKQRDGNE